jgi:hypothetical protein
MLISGAATRQMNKRREHNHRRTNYEDHLNDKIIDFKTEGPAKRTTLNSMRINQQPRVNRYRLTSLVLRSVPYKKAEMPATRHGPGT